MYGMPTTWFFDGAGTGREGGVIVLSGVGGSDAMWGRLNPLWNAALAKLGVPVRHSTDYFRSTGRKHRSVLPAMLLNLIGEQLVQEFNCVSFAADKRAIEMVNLQYPGTVPSLPKLLMRLCFRGLCASADDTQQKSRINVFFDRSEPFIHHLKSPWQAGRRELKRLKGDGWPSQICKIETADSAAHPGLQIADLLSWAIRCRYQYGDRLIDPKIPMVMLPFMAAGKLRGGFLDADSIWALCIEKRDVNFAHKYKFV